MIIAACRLLLLPLRLPLLLHSPLLLTICCCFSCCFSQYFICCPFACFAFLYYLFIMPACLPALPLSLTRSTPLLSSLPSSPSLPLSHSTSPFPTLLDCISRCARAKLVRAFLFYSYTAGTVASVQRVSQWQGRWVEGQGVSRLALLL